MPNPLVSVIVPVFNAEEHIAKSLNSVLSQTYKHLEVVVIDDGSTDRTLDVARQVASEDYRVRIVAQRNQGVSTARNAGLNAASGDLICFLDADDWIEPHAYASIVPLFSAHDVDFATFGYSVDTQGSSRLAPMPACYIGRADRRKGLEVLLRTQNRFVWSRVFRRTVIGEIRFDPEIHWGEDTLFVAEVAARAHSSITISDTLYRYEQTAGSATRSSVNPKRLSGLRMTERLRDVIGPVHPGLLPSVLTTRVNMIATLTVDAQHDRRLRNRIRRKSLLELPSVLRHRGVRPRTKVKAMAASFGPGLLRRRYQR